MKNTFGPMHKGFILKDRFNTICFKEILLLDLLDAMYIS